MGGNPNFLIFMTDQLSGIFFPDGPAPFMKTPVLRALSDQAVNFANAYCASPLCTPSRISFMTGQLPSHTRVYDNAAEFASSNPTFAHYLRDLGYLTVLSGKMHFVGADQLHGFEERLTTDIYPADFGWTPDWTEPDRRIDWWYHNLSSVTGAGVAATTNQLEFDDEVTYFAKLKLSQLARQEDTRPFCLTVSFSHPHDPYVARQKYWDLYDDDTIPPPRQKPIAFGDQDDHSRRLMEVSDWCNHQISKQHTRDARRAYFANVSYLDERIGEILEVLKSLRLDDNTVILFCADHGDMLGERGLWYKMSFLEPSARVPLMIHAPGRFAPRQVTTPVSLMDILPTLVDLVGGNPRQTVDPIDGESLCGLMSGDEDPARPVFAEYAAEGAVDPMLMVRRGRWKYVYGESDGAQLFDLAEDPTETRDVAGKIEHGDVEHDLRRQLDANWDLAAFHREVLASQRRRRMIHRALRQGGHTSWDYRPLQSAADRFMRNHLDLNDLEAFARFPRPT